MLCLPRRARPPFSASIVPRRPYFHLFISPSSLHHHFISPSSLHHLPISRSSQSSPLRLNHFDLHLSIISQSSLNHFHLSVISIIASAATGARCPVRAACCVLHICCPPLSARRFLSGFLSACCFLPIAAVSPRTCCSSRPAVYSTPARCSPYHTQDRLSIPSFNSQSTYFAKNSSASRPRSSLHHLSTSKFFTFVHTHMHTYR